MDSIEKAAALIKGITNKTQGAMHSANVTTLTGIAKSDSANGIVQIDLGGTTIGESDAEQAVEIETTVDVRKGDTVQIQVAGADGTAKSLLVTGVIAGGDRTRAEIAALILSVAEEYGTSADPATPPIAWQATAPAWQEGVYIWTHSVITRGDGSIETTEPICTNAGKGESGDPGVGIQSIDVYYYLSTSSTTPTGGTWSTTAPTWEDGRYMWSKTITTMTDGSETESDPVCITGAQGKTGPQGPKGATGPAGTSSYTHIAYATSADGRTGFSVSDGAEKTYIGIYVDTVAQDSADPSKYQWTLIKGADGAQGAPGKAGVDGKTPYFHIAYATSADGKTGFSTTVSAGKTYIGQYTDYAQADSTDPTKYAWTLIKGDTGPQGQKGATGTGVQATVTQYYLSTSSTTPTGGSWSTTQPAWVSGKYLWTREHITWTTGATTDTAPVLAAAINAANTVADSAKTEAAEAQAKAEDLQTLIRETDAGIEVGKVNSSGDYEGYHALISSEGSFKVVDTEGHVVAKLAENGLSVVSNNTGEWADDSNVTSAIHLWYNGLDYMANLFCSYQMIGMKKRTIYDNVNADGVLYNKHDGEATLSLYSTLEGIVNSKMSASLKQTQFNAFPSSVSIGVRTSQTLGQNPDQYYVMESVNGKGKDTSSELWIEMDVYITIMRMLKDLVLGRGERVNFVDLVYPVGAIYISVNAADPADLFGGTWQAINGRFLLAQSDVYPAGSTGGEATHKLTVDEMPSHTHKYGSMRQDADPDTSGSHGYKWSAINNSQTTEATGGNNAHNNMPPYIAVYMWERVE